MDSYLNISKELKTYFNENSFFKVLLPFDVVLIFVGVIFMLFNGILPGIGLGSGFFGYIFRSLAYWGFRVGIILAYANLNEKYMYSGLFLYSFLYVFWFFKYITSFNLGYLISAFIYGGLGYLIYKRTSTSKATD